MHQVLSLIADQIAAIPPLPSHGLVTGLTAMHGLSGRNDRQVGPSQQPQHPRAVITTK